MVPPGFSEHGAKGMVQVIPACVRVFPSCLFQGASKQRAAAIGFAWRKERCEGPDRERLAPTPYDALDEPAECMPGHQSIFGTV